MKKILFATALIGFAFMQVNAQSPAPATTAKPGTTKMADPAAPKAATKTETKAASSDMQNGKPATHAKTTKHASKEHKEAAKTAAPAEKK
jgi:hypothetical protein